MLSLQLIFKILNAKFEQIGTTGEQLIFNTALIYLSHVILYQVISEVISVISEVVCEVISDRLVLFIWDVNIEQQHLGFVHLGTFSSSWGPFSLVTGSIMARSTWSGLLCDFLRLRWFLSTNGKTEDSS